MKGGCRLRGDRNHVWTCRGSATAARLRARSGALPLQAPSPVPQRPPPQTTRSLGNVTRLGTGSPRGAVMHPMWLINTRVGTKHRGVLSGLVEWPPKHPGRRPHLLFLPRVQRGLSLMLI